MALRCVYTDLDGTLLGKGASLFRDGEGQFTLMAARALEACHRVGVEVVLTSGRRRAQVMEDARLIGQSAYIFEVGSGLAIEGETTWITGRFQPTEARTIHQLIAETGAPEMLLREYVGRLEHHSPWHLDREVSHLFRGKVDPDEVNPRLEGLRLVDNGKIGEGIHAYHLIPAESSKAAAVDLHMRARGYAREECIAVGDSREDLGVAAHVGKFFLVANADPSLRGGEIEVTEGSHGEGFYEAVVGSLMSR
ncbi:MAG: HAD hydrolase family protein [Actinomycetota bacterium]|nr:HAD hydrolase family protein [Actinomycetota bacterium]MDQ3648543.1 HAD hydrolase family protein [Actinomycetota bacterium]